MSTRCKSKIQNKTARANTQPSEGNKWFEMRIGAQTYSILLSNSIESPEINGCEGVTLPSRSTIILQEDLHRDRMYETLTHELKHAIFDYMGIRHYLMTSLNIPEERAGEIEEALIRMLSPALFDTLSRNGFINYPPIHKTTKKARRK